MKILHGVFIVLGGLFVLAIVIATLYVMFLVISFFAVFIGAILGLLLIIVAVVMFCDWAEREIGKRRKGK